MGSQSDIASQPSQSARRIFELIGGIAALLAALVFRRWLSAELGMLQALGVVHVQPLAAPSSPIEWFGLLHTNALVGLLLLNVFDIVNYVLAAFMYLGIYSLLRGKDHAYLGLGMVLAAIGVAVYITSNQALNLLSLSNQFFAATSDFQRQLLLSAGQYALAVNDPVAFGTGTFWSYVFFYSAGLLMSIGMLKSGFIGKWMGIVGIVANVFGLGYFFTSFFGHSLSIIPALGSAPTNLVWYIAVGIQLIRISQKKASSRGTAVKEFTHNKSLEQSP
jgi:hypothetical protein